jgi:uncharacterized protein YdhG (YjbR/CyaY superfamily)
MNTVDDYISMFPMEIQNILQKMRATILTNAPGATEELAYKMPSYRLDGRRLVYFAAYKNHIGFYATPTGHEAFEKELSQYKRGRGSVQFPLSKPIPYELIGQMVQFRAEENKMIKGKKKTIG